MKKTRKAFTLVEFLLLAIICIVILVFVVLGIIKYFDDSNKEKYVENVHEYVEGTANLIKAGEVVLSDWNATYYFPINCIPLEHKTDDYESLFDSGYVVAVNMGNNYDYYFTGRDSSNIGIYLSYDGVLDKDSVVSDVKKIDTTVGVGGRENIVKFSDSCDFDVFEQYISMSNIKERWKLEIK